MRLLIFMIFLAVGSVHADSMSALTKLEVFKSKTCGCCVKWIEKLNEKGFDAVGINVEQLGSFKSSKGIAPKYQSCHTALSSQGFVFEGHVPAKHISQFLSNPIADAIGLAVPGMPFGSPGMEVGGRFDKYNVLVLMEDGSAEIYAHIAGPSDQ